MDTINHKAVIQEKPIEEGISSENVQVFQPSEEIPSDSIARARELEEIYQRSALPEGFFINRDKLFYEEKSQPASLLDDVDARKKSSKKSDTTYVSSRLDVTACTRDKENENHGRLLEFKDIDGHLHTWAMPMTCLAGDGTAYREILLSKGLEIAPGRTARNLLTTYIQSCHPKARIRCVDKLGWHNDCFIFPEETIGSSSSEKIIFQGLKLQSRDYSINGSLDEWKTHVASLCQGNSRLMLGVCAAFAAPLLNLLNHEGGGLHFRGPSSIGKSTILNVASSVWGGKDPIVSWRATSNGLEGIAVLHNDGLLCLDELAQISPDDAANVAYMLPDGIGKQKLQRNSELRKGNRWKILFLSNGEISLAQHIEKSGQKSKAGQEVRIVDIPADIGGQTVFEDLHGFLNGGAFAEYLKEVSHKYHGSAIREFLIHLTKEKTIAIKHAITLVEKLLKDWMPAKASGQVRRVLRRFALVAVGGEFATTFGVTGWKTGEAIEGVKQCWIAWLKERGNCGHLEEQQVLSQVRCFFALHGDSRFSPWNPEDHIKTINRAGFKKIIDGVTEFFVYKEIFIKDICNGLDPTFVAKVCVEHNLLIPSNDGKSTRGEKLPGHAKTIRCYRFSSDVLGEEIS